MNKEQIIINRIQVNFSFLIIYILSKQFQGRPFYAVSGKALCERDYWDTLEKCCVCTEPILDRILRATGKPYHPKCFTCVVCNQSLDGIPFTVDAVNRIHCIEDFHKRYLWFIFTFCFSYRPRATLWKCQSSSWYFCSQLY